MASLVPDKDPRTLRDLAAMLGRFTKGTVGVVPTPPTPAQQRATARAFLMRLARYRQTGDIADLSRPAL